MLPPAGRLLHLEQAQPPPAVLSAAPTERLLGSRQPPRSPAPAAADRPSRPLDRKSTRLNSSHANISYAVFCLKKKATSTSSPALVTVPSRTPAPLFDDHLQADIQSAYRAARGTMLAPALLDTSPRRVTSTDVA